jgi:hypothetical protein
MVVELLRCKARLSVLWVFMAVSMSAFMFLYFMMPDVMKELMAGRMEGEPLSEMMMVAYALFWLIPLIMAVLCLTLNGSANRWLNFVLGILVALLMIFDIASHLAAGEAASVALWLIGIAMIVVPAFIAWFGWRLPKQQA